jgi:sugar phosphate isomerase/epimerase
MTAKNGLRLGTTIYSFTNEYQARKYSLEELIVKVGELGLGPGVELVGFSHVRGFPRVTDQFAGWLRNLYARYNLEPSCLAINADVQINRKRRMTDDECYDYHVVQLQAAAKLGYPVVRYQFPAGTEVVRRLAPLAEKLNVKMGLEIHAPDSPHSQTVLAFREMYEKVQSPYLGFIPDFGSCATDVPLTFIEHFRHEGIVEKHIDIALTCWRMPGTREERMAEYIKRMKAAGASELDTRKMMSTFVMVSRMNPRDWLEIMPQVVHIHGKCYDFDKNNHEPAIPYEDILPVFVEGGYNGFMSTEWEGHAFSDEDGFAKVQAHHALCRQILDKALSSRQHA